MTARNITEINIHCSATRPEWMQERSGFDKVAEIRRWHVDQNGWSDIGYHWIIDRDGTVYRGRPESMTGAFEPKVNARGIGVCLLGGFGSGANDAFEQHYTWHQDSALRELIQQIKDRHPGATKVTGHNDYSPKACPGFRVARWLDGKQPQRSFAQSGTAIGSGTATVAAGGLAVAEVYPAIQALSASTHEVKGAVEQAKAVDQADPLRWVLIALIIAGAAFALYRRWADWQRGRQ